MESGQRIYRYVLAALIAIAVLQLLQAEAPPQGLLGRWRCMETSKGGLGPMVSFRADGTLEYSFGAIVEMPYRLEGDEIVLPPATTDGPEQRDKVNFTGQDQLNFGGEQLARVGIVLDKKLLILGEWKGKRDMGGNHVEVHYIFYPDRKCLLLIPFLIVPGKYTIQGSTIHLELSKQSPYDGKFQFKDEILTLPNPNGKGNSYRRY